MTTGPVSQPDPPTRIVYAAWHMWNIAADATQRAKDTKAEHPDACTADTVSAIILSAMATEAFINELGDRLVRLDTSSHSTIQQWAIVGTLLNEFEEARIQITSKYLLASKLLPGDCLHEGKQPYQDFQLLIRIRNDFAHPKAQVEAPKYFKVFADKGWAYNVKSDSIKLVGWMLQLETPQVAQWACRAAHSIIWDIVERFDGASEPTIQSLHAELKQQWAVGMNDARVT